MDLKAWQRYLSNMVDTVLSPVSFLPPGKKENKSNLPFTSLSAECTIKDTLLLACSLITRASANNLDLILLGSPKLGGGKECCEFIKVENVRLSPPPRSLVSVVARILQLAAVLISPINLSAQQAEPLVA